MRGLVSAAQSGDAALLAKTIKQAGGRRGVDWQEAGTLFTALHYAALTGFLDGIHMLLEAGATVDIVDSKGMTPLHLASWNKQVQSLALLLAANALVDLRTHNGETSLMLASTLGHAEIVAALLRANADATIKSKENLTALELAAKVTLGGGGGGVFIVVVSRVCSYLSQRPR
eukprot:m.126095 g.126095  ORF g.126095 m.126095 type:complete len:173 (-) comp52229_c0_seq8:1416-1934(-)